MIFVLQNAFDRVLSNSRPSSWRLARCLAWLVGLALIAVSQQLRASDEGARIRAFESALGPAILVTGHPQQRWTLRERMVHWKVPGVSVAVIRNGRLAWARGYGVVQAGTPGRVNADTMFSVGSVSKIPAAAMTLRLVDAGRVDLDRNVSEYLTRWHIPDNPYTQIRPVTLRGILSHTAGLTVHGFPDFKPGESLPTSLETLQGQSPARNKPVEVEYPPGSKFQYSGGGTTVEQLLIEEVTHLDFATAARQHVFDPLRMTRSTYVSPLPETYGNVAKAHDAEGKPTALPRGYESFAESAASGLWTTPSDVARLVIALMAAYRGAPDGFLSPELARQMLTEVGRSPAGLGPFLEGSGLSRRFFHGGANDSYRAWMEGHPGTGNGVVIFTNGAHGDPLVVEVRRAVAVSEGWAPELSATWRVPEVRLTPRELADNAGVYEVQSGNATLHFRHRSKARVYRVTHEEGTLYWSVDASSKRQPLVPQGSTRFLLDAGRDVLEVEFVRDYGGGIGSLILRGAANYMIEARKI